MWHETWHGLLVAGEITGIASLTILVLGVIYLTWPPWPRRRKARAERDARNVLGVAANHPERVVGSDEAASRGHFPAWAAELAEDGIDAGQIIESYRRGL